MLFRSVRSWVIPARLDGHGRTMGLFATFRPIMARVAFDKAGLIRVHFVQRRPRTFTSGKATRHQIPVKYPSAPDFRAFRAVHRSGNDRFSSGHQIPVKYPNAWVSAGSQARPVLRHAWHQRTTPSKAHTSSVCWPRSHPRAESSSQSRPPRAGAKPSPRFASRS